MHNSTIYLLLQTTLNHSLFQENRDGLTEEERLFAEKYWQRMIDEGGIDRFNQKENQSKKESERYMLVGSELSNYARLILNNNPTMTK
ncbi:MAG: hypothetical protein ACK5IJ_11165 [Mangrovibacterium sp.]